jgi:hypothetical protein
MDNLTGRHPSTVALARWYEFDHLREGLIRDTSAACADLAQRMIDTLPDDPELSAGLRHLLEAKDALVRAAIRAADDA